MTESGLINTNLETNDRISNNVNEIIQEKDEFQIFLNDSYYHRISQSFNLNGIDGKSIYRILYIAVAQRVIPIFWHGYQLYTLCHLLLFTIVANYLWVTKHRDPIDSESICHTVP